MPEEGERIAALEALREAHDQRHSIFDRELEKTFQGIYKTLEAGGKRFDKIDAKLDALHRDFANSTNCQPLTNGKKAKNMVIRVGTPMATGGGLVAIIMWAIEHLAG